MSRTFQYPLIINAQIIVQLHYTLYKIYYMAYCCQPYCITIILTSHSTTHKMAMLAMVDISGDVVLMAVVRNNDLITNAVAVISHDMMRS